MTTQSPDLPTPLVVMQDAEFAKRHPHKAFYLRITDRDGSAATVDLNGAVTLLDAREVARGLGFDPTHWIAPGDSRPSSF